MKKVMRYFVICRHALVVLLMIPLPLTTMAGTDGNEFREVVRKASATSLLRIKAAQLSGLGGECKYSYEAEILHSYKGEFPVSFFARQGLLVGTRYLAIVMQNDRCGVSSPLVGLPSIPSFYPLLPYGVDFPDDVSWVAIGGGHYVFPDDVTVFEPDDWKNICRVQVDVGVANLCLSNPPVARFQDLDGLLRDLGERLEKGNGAD